jgi:leader peptidase (prepilin peptidase) / N-methyltransferase
LLALGASVKKNDNLKDYSVPAEWIMMAFIFAYGAVIGSFLNVVIYRLPREKSLVFPPSACPSCDTHIRWYDNIPLFSWLILRAKCRFCKAPISIRYFLIELLTACLFLFVYLWYFYFQKRQMGFAGDLAIRQFLGGGWLVYLNAVVLIGAFVAASAIDLELWIIPLGICWLVTAVGTAAGTLAGFVIQPTQIEIYQLFPIVGTRMAAISLGAAVGLIFSLAGLWSGLIKPSYPMQEGENLTEEADVKYNDRVEILKEIIFLLPVIVGGVIGYYLLRVGVVKHAFVNLLQVYAVKGFIGALAGYLAGCTTVWATRIFGTLGFGREAMGLGDVHLMGAAGAVIGPQMVVIAFFIAPFFGLVWALYQWIFKKSRQIPYGPFLSTAVFGVMIYHDWIRNVLLNFYGFN